MKKPPRRRRLYRTRITFVCTRELREELAILCDMQGASLGELLRMLVRQEIRAAVRLAAAQKK